MDASGASYFIRSAHTHTHTRICDWPWTPIIIAGAYAREHAHFHKPASLAARLEQRNGVAVVATWSAERSGVNFRQRDNNIALVDRKGACECRKNRAAREVARIGRIARASVQCSAAAFKYAHECEGAPVVLMTMMVMMVG